MTTTLAPTTSFLCGDCPLDVDYPTREAREAHQDATGHGHRRMVARGMFRPMAQRGPRDLTSEVPYSDPRPVQDVAAARAARGVAPVVPPTEKQLAYLRTLLAERAGHPTAEAMRSEMNRRREAGSLQKAVVSKAIDALLSIPKTEATPGTTAAPAEKGGTAQADLLDALPAGRYFVADTFVRVDRPSKGQWAGFIFVKRLPHPDHDGYRIALRNPKSSTVKVDDGFRQVLDALLEDPKAAAVEYGHRTGSCCVCGRTLTDPESVEAGIGPICAAKF